MPWKYLQFFKGPDDWTSYLYLKSSHLFNIMDHWQIVLCWFLSKFLPAAKATVSLPTGKRVG